MFQITIVGKEQWQEQGKNNGNNSYNSADVKVYESGVCKSTFILSRIKVLILGSF